MELQIQDLVSSIRKEGIEAANAEAESIIAEAKKKADYVIVIVHGGIEGYPLPAPRMQEWYRFFIDSGARNYRIFFG